MLRYGSLFLTLASLAWTTLCFAQQTYDVEYHAEILPTRGIVATEIRLSGERLPSRLVLHIDPERHRTFTSTDALQIAPGEVTWRPQGKFSRLRYEFVINHERTPGKYDSYVTDDWALFRADKLVPRTSVRAKRGLQAHSTLQFTAPAGWSISTPYAPTNEQQYVIDDPQRRFDRPEGWILAGKIGSRTETIAGVRTVVAAPVGDSARRQDALAFLNWNLPRLLAVFDGSFPRRLLVVSAGDPMWRGGLSGPGSVFLHADRPLISENRTSTLLHELVHVALGIRGDRDSDWIVEGFAEYYSLETLRRSGTISEQRYSSAVKDLTRWGTRAKSVLVPQSTGAVTARAVLVLREVDAEIRERTGGRHGLDDVARELADRRGEVSLELLQELTTKIAGAPVRALDRERLSAPIPPRAP